MINTIRVAFAAALLAIHMTPVIGAAVTVDGAAVESVDGPDLLVEGHAGQASQAGSIILNPNPPPQPTRLIFIHHSTGENLLADGNGGLGIALRDNRYFVSDTNYGWGPGLIGDTTDIGHWWLWYRGPASATYLSALYAESLQHAAYSRLPTAPAGPNTIVLFKSCFPNSALQGNAADPVPPIGTNPLRGQDSYSPYHTVANAKGIYISLLDYFRTRQDKLFVVLAAPPLSDPTYAANARAFNQWLSTQWLENYPYRNVAVFDFYNVLTTNGGSPDVNDLGQATGNHHRVVGGVIAHKTDGDNDTNPNILEYPSGDDHPSQAGNLKATAEFVPVLNLFYHCWRGTGGCPGAAPSALLGRAISSSSNVLSWKDNSVDEDGFAVERKPGGCAAGTAWARIGTAPRNAVSFRDVGLTPARTYAYRVNAYNAQGRSASTACVAVGTGLAGTPNSPTGLMAYASGAASVTLKWTDQSTNETGFRVDRRKGTGAWLPLATLGSGVTTYTDATASGNAAATPYRYAVTACNAVGCAPVTAMAAVPYAPTALTAVGADVGRIRLGWMDKSSNESGFVVYRKAGNCVASSAWTQVGTTSADAASFVSAGLTTGQTYAYRVRAWVRSPDQPYANGYSLYTNCAAATAP